MRHWYKLSRLYCKRIASVLERARSITNYFLNYFNSSINNKYSEKLKIENWSLLNKIKINGSKLDPSVTPEVLVKLSKIAP